MEHRATPVCPICGARNWAVSLSVIDHHLTQETFELSDCGSCGFRITLPVLTAAQLARYYSAQTYLSHDASGAGPLRLAYRMSRYLALRLKHRLVAQRSPQGELLDVGCGSGAFLAYMVAKGYHGEGVEPDPVARQAATTRSQTRVHADLGEIPGHDRFDTITLWHVLEHTAELNETLCRLFELLKPDGHLFIAVPNRSAYDAAHYGPYWAAWDVPRHRWHFRERDLRNLLSAKGFAQPTIRRMWLDAYYIALLSEYYKGLPGWCAWIHSLVQGTASNCHALLRGTLTSSMLLIARKPMRTSSSE